LRKLSRKAQSLWAKKSRDGKLLWLPLVSHLADSAAVSQKLWNHWLSDGVKKAIADGITGNGSTERLLTFLAAAHDIGKATPVFQVRKSVRKDLDERIEERIHAAGLPMEPLSVFSHADKTPHALATQILLEQAGCSKNIAVILGAHHGKPPDNYTLVHCGIGAYEENYYLGKKGKDEWATVQRELIDFALELAGFSAIEDVPNPNQVSQVLLSGLLIMADWIASNEEYFSYIRPEDAPETDAQSRANSAWMQLNLLSPWDVGNAWMRPGLYQERFDFIKQPNAMQSAVVQSAASIHAPGILVLEAPMGEGKTEAALVAAEIFAYKAKRKGVFFALPTQATSDGIFPRMLKWVNRLNSDKSHSMRLMHGKAEFNEEYQNLAHGVNIGEDESGGVFVHEWFEGRKRSMLDDFVVGTIDQLLLAALKQKHVMLRHLGLDNKVVIIDECHAYDAYMGWYLRRVLSWLGAYHVPVIVLSATLPAQKRQTIIEAYLSTNFTPEPISDPLGRGSQAAVQTPEWIPSRDYPLITFTDGGNIKQTPVLAGRVPRDVHLGFLSENDLMDRIEDLLSDGGCAGVVVNTVRRAQELGMALCKHFGEGTVQLLHSRFLAPDRAEKERILLKELGKPDGDTQRPERRIMIGTQVLEQSLDIDFDVLATDICPMDLLLQRIGRLHRHERTRPEKLRTAQCLVMGINGEGFERDSEKIYGKYLLMRTKARLPQRITLPMDIPDLVQDVYDDELALLPDSTEYRKAKQEQEMRIADKKARAANFCICPPQSDPKADLVGWLDTDVSDKCGEAAVRDTDESIEVLLVMKKRDGRLHFLPWIENGRELPQDEVPDDGLAKALARCSVRLPVALCAPWAIDQTIRELEGLCREQVPTWQQSRWLKGELFLILDENGSTNLCGYRLTYDQCYGLLYEKEVNADV
jgi:CRISPR-associated endonuclease/helicase Cas3